MKILAAGDMYMPPRYFEQGSRVGGRHTTSSTARSTTIAF